MASRITPPGLCVQLFAPKHSFPKLQLPSREATVAIESPKTQLLKLALLKSWLEDLRRIPERERHAYISHFVELSSKINQYCQPKLQFIEQKLSRTTDKYTKLELLHHETDLRDLQKYEKETGSYFPFTSKDRVPHFPSKVSSPTLSDGPHTPPFSEKTKIAKARSDTSLPGFPSRAFSSPTLSTISETHPLSHSSKGSEIPQSARRFPSTASSPNLTTLSPPALPQVPSSGKTELLTSALRESQLYDLNYEIECHLADLIKEILTTPWAVCKERLNSISLKITHLAKYDGPLACKLRRMRDETANLLHFECFTRIHIQPFCAALSKKATPALICEYEEFDQKYGTFCNALKAVLKKELPKGYRALVENTIALLENAKDDVQTRITEFNEKIKNEGVHSSSSSSSSTPALSVFDTLPEKSSVYLSAPKLSEIAIQLIDLCPLLDKGNVEKVMTTLNSYKTKIHFNWTKLQLTIRELVFYYHKNPNVFSSQLLKNAIVKTCTLLALEGFIHVLKSEGRQVAEKMFVDLFFTLGIWSKYCELRDMSLNNISNLSVESEKMIILYALSEIYRSLL